VQVRGEEYSLLRQATHVVCDTTHGLDPAAAMLGAFIIVNPIIPIIKTFPLHQMRGFCRQVFSIVNFIAPFTFFSLLTFLVQNNPCSHVPHCYLLVAQGMLRARSSNPPS
jgi:hypothetical protein